MIEYRKGNVFQHNEPGLKILPHICNDLGGWGAGFVTHLSKKWFAPEIAYRAWFHQDDFQLGNIQVVPTEPDWIVVNMIAQHAYSLPEHPAIRYEALEQCLNKVHRLHHAVGGTIVTIKFGTGLAGGSWEKIEPMLLNLQIPTIVYEL